MSTFLEIETAARRLSVDERQRLLLSLAASLRAERMLDSRSMDTVKATSWLHLQDVLFVTESFDQLFEAVETVRERRKAVA